MAALAVTVADAVAQQITDATDDDPAVLNQTIEVARRFIPRDAIKTLTTAKVSVVPAGLEEFEEGGTRGKVRVLVHTDIGVARKVANDTEVATMLELADQIDALFRKERLTAYASAWWRETKYTVLYVPEMYEQDKTFLAVLRITVETRR